MNSIRVHYLRDPQTSLFSNFFIKNWSHSIIHTFKNYFATMFLVFSKISCIQMDQLHNFSHKSAQRYCVSAFHNSRFLLLSSSSSSSSSSFLIFYLFFIFIFLAVVVDFSTVNSVRVYYLRDPQTSLFSNFFIKNGSHNTIHIFKKLFCYSVFSF